MSRKRRECRAQRRAYLARADKHNARVNARIAKQKADGVWVNPMDWTSEEIASGKSMRQISHARRKRTSLLSSLWGSLKRTVTRGTR